MTPSPEVPVAPPRIAVVIVSRNSAESLSRCLDLLYGSPLFLIVVDCGSGDTAGLDEHFPGVRFIRLPRNFGMTKALNLGIRAAETEYIALLSPEVEITFETLDALATVLEAEPLTGAVCPLLVGSDQVSELPREGAVTPAARAATAGERVPCASIDAILLRSFFLRALRHIDERYGDYGAEIELCQQIRRAGKTILIHPTATAKRHTVQRATNAAMDADRELGLSRFLSKHYGFWTGTSYWIGRILTALIRFRFVKAWLLMSQTKIDGNS